MKIDGIDLQDLARWMDEQDADDPAVDWTGFGAVFVKVAPREVLAEMAARYRRDRQRGQRPALRIVREAGQA